MCRATLHLVFEEQCRRVEQVQTQGCVGNCLSQGTTQFKVSPEVQLAKPKGLCWCTQGHVPCSGRVVQSYMASLFTQGWFACVWPSSRSHSLSCASNGLGAACERILPHPQSLTHPGMGAGMPHWRFWVCVGPWVLLGGQGPTLSLGGASDRICKTSCIVSCRSFLVPFTHNPSP